MAVFPERIVLKTSSDDPSLIISAIQSGGTDEIATGEIVVGNLAGNVKLFTLDSNGDVIAIGGVGTGGGSGGDGGGGRGDGGNFNDGTVEITFAFGIYGGGDFNAANGYLTVAPFAHAYIDGSNVGSATDHTNMSAAAHVYVASTDSYIDFTFDVEQSNTDYSVLHSGEAGWNVLEVSNKTTTGFRVNFYDEATGNVLTSGAVGIGAPVITVYDSDPTTAVANNGGTDLPVELLNGDEGPDGGTF